LDKHDGRGGGGKWGIEKHFRGERLPESKKLRKNLKDDEEIERA